MLVERIIVKIHDPRMGVVYELYIRLHFKSEFIFFKIKFDPYGVGGFVFYVVLLHTTPLGS